MHMRAAVVKGTSYTQGNDVEPEASVSYIRHSSINAVKALACMHMPYSLFKGTPSLGRTCSWEMADVHPSGQLLSAEESSKYACHDGMTLQHASLAAIGKEL